MLALSPLTKVKNEKESQIQDFSMAENEFQGFMNGNLLDRIDFDDIFVGISDGDLLPDLEMEQEIIADFSVSAGQESETKMSSVGTVNIENEKNAGNSENPAAELVSDAGFGSSSLIQGEEIVNKREESVVNNNLPSKKADKSRKSSSHSKNLPGKKKEKVDWTPELHRRFVQAVEHLGLDKAVPSRILEIMEIDTLTRHNIASHLQKYRLHRKHLLALEAEAASWNQRRQKYGTVAASVKREVNPWIAPTMGFPPMTPMSHFRPIHVWGHPSVDQSLMPMWPEHHAHPPPPPHALPRPHPLPPSPPTDYSFWHSNHQYVPLMATPCFPRHLPPTRFPSPPVVGIPPPDLYIDSGVGVPVGQKITQPPSLVHPSKESIDAAIGDALTTPLPIGLKPPSIDSVIAELQRQGISKLPPNCS